MTSRVWRLPGMVALALVLFLLAGGAVGAGIALLRGSPTASGAGFEVGRWLLQLGTVLAGTGLITAVFRQVDVTRARRESWTAVLQDLVVGQDAVEGAAMRLVSSPDAQTYTELVDRCRDLRALLRRVIALPEVYNSDGALRRQVDRMRRYLKPVITEYARESHRISRQEALDRKVWELRLLKLANDTDRSRRANPGELLRPLGVSGLVRDSGRLPALAALLADLDTLESEFRQRSEIDDAYEQVKSILRTNAGAQLRRRVL